MEDKKSTPVGGSQSTGRATRKSAGNKQRLSPEVKHKGTYFKLSPYIQKWLKENSGKSECGKCGGGLSQRQLIEEALVEHYGIEKPGLSVEED